jgi:hypothetical protein
LGAVGGRNTELSLPKQFVDDVVTISYDNSYTASTAILAYVGGYDTLVSLCRHVAQPKGVNLNKLPQDFVVVDAGYPEAGLNELGVTLLPLMGQPIVAVYNLPTLSAANKTLVCSPPLSGKKVTKY